MRPGDFSPGNTSSAFASTRPSRGFNEAGGFLPRKRYSSRRPITGSADRFNEAGGFLPRKQPAAVRDAARSAPGFNEAGGFLPRKHPHGLPAGDHRRASMRPGDFSPGNPSVPGPACAAAGRFNEAGGFLPRKHLTIDSTTISVTGFNEAGGFLPRKLGVAFWQMAVASRLQ